MKILLPRTFRECPKNAHGNCYFGWVELNIMLSFLISEMFRFLVRMALYFRMEGVIMISPPRLQQLATTEISLLFC